MKLEALQKKQEQEEERKKKLEDEKKRKQEEIKRFANVLNALHVESFNQILNGL